MERNESSVKFAFKLILFLFFVFFVIPLVFMGGACALLNGTI